MNKAIYLIILFCLCNCSNDNEIKKDAEQVANLICAYEKYKTKADSLQLIINDKYNPDKMRQDANDFYGKLNEQMKTKVDEMSAKSKEYDKKYLKEADNEKFNMLINEFKRFCK